MNALKAVTDVHRYALTMLVATPALVSLAIA